MGLAPGFFFEGFPKLSALIAMNIDILLEGENLLIGTNFIL